MSALTRMVTGFVIAMAITGCSEQGARVSTAIELDKTSATLDERGLYCTLEPGYPYRTTCTVANEEIAMLPNSMVIRALDSLDESVELIIDVDSARMTYAAADQAGVESMKTHTGRVMTKSEFAKMLDAYISDMVQRHDKQIEAAESWKS